MAPRLPAVSSAKSAVPVIARIDAANMRIAAAHVVPGTGADLCRSTASAVGFIGISSMCLSMQAAYLSSRHRRSLPYSAGNLKKAPPRCRYGEPHLPGVAPRDGRAFVGMALARDL